MNAKEKVWQPTLNMKLATAMKAAAPRAEKPAEKPREERRAPTSRFTRAVARARKMLRRGA